jgi:hypothetical protein
VVRPQRVVAEAVFDGPRGGERRRRRVVADRVVARSVAGLLSSFASLARPLRMSVGPTPIAGLEIDQAQDRVCERVVPV